MRDFVRTAGDIPQLEPKPGSLRDSEMDLIESHTQPTTVASLRSSTGEIEGYTVLGKERAHRRRRELGRRVDRQAGERRVEISLHLLRSRESSPFSFLSQRVLAN